MSSPLGRPHDLRILRKSKSVDSVFAPSKSSQPANPAESAAKFRNGLGSSLMHIAAYFGNSELVEELRGLGLNLNERNSLRWSSHHYLCRFHQPLNKKLSLGLKPQRADQQSKRFRFRYSKTVS